MVSPLLSVVIKYVHTSCSPVFQYFVYLADNVAAILLPYTLCTGC